MRCGRGGPDADGVTGDLGGLSEAREGAGRWRKEEGEKKCHHAIVKRTVMC